MDDGSRVFSIIGSNGKIGIGTQNPDKDLDVTVSTFFEKPITASGGTIVSGRLSLSASKGIKADHYVAKTQTIAAAGSDSVIT